MQPSVAFPDFCPDMPIRPSKSGAAESCCASALEDAHSSDCGSSTGRCPRKRSRICSFCSCVWDTPDMMTFQGHSSGMCSTIHPIMAPGSRERFSRRSAGRKRRRLIAPPSRTAISKNTFFIASPFCCYGIGTACSPAGEVSRRQPAVLGRTRPRPHRRWP